MVEGTKRHTFPITKEIRSEEAMYTTENTVKDTVTSHVHRWMVDPRGDRTVVHINAESLCCTLATTTGLYVNYISIKKKVLKKIL